MLIPVQTSKTCNWWNQWVTVSHRILQNQQDIYWQTLKRNTWIAALIEVLKKNAKLSFGLYVKECSFIHMEKFVQ